MRWRKTVTVVGLATLLALIWADRRETRRELRHLADRLDAQVTLPVPQRPAPSPPVVSSVASAPAESDRASYPPYIIETPDILLIDPTRIAPLPSYQVEPLDVLHTAGKNVLAADPIDGLFAVGPDGTVDLGPAYGGTVRVAGLTVAESQRVLQAKVRALAPRAELAVSLAQCRGIQQIAGEHLVRPDGTVGLGGYGSVYVAGTTTAQAKAAIEKHLSKYLDRPAVGVEVYGHNSKFYYVVFNVGQAEVVRLPLTGNETVIDGLVAAGGVRGRDRINVWVARPVEGEPDRILPVRYADIVRLGDVTTNHQLRSGDRVFVARGE